MQETKQVTTKKFRLTITEQYWEELTESEMHEKISNVETSGIKFWKVERVK